MKKLLLVLCFSISTFVSGQTSSLVIGGVLDLDLPEAGSTGKSLELVAIADIADLSVYAIGVANNGAGTDGLEFDLPAVSLAEGESFWLLRDSAAYHNYFGNVFGDNNVNWVIANPVSQNGDDAIELFLKSANDTTLVDLYGDQNTDGTGEYWEYTDAWAYRNCDSRTPSATFDSTQWTIATPNCSDDSEANATSTCPYPINSCNVVSITFQVDMSNEDVSADGVHIAGSFQGWDPALTVMSDEDDDMVYELMYDILEPAGTTIEYKFVNGNAWGDDEGIAANRSLVVPSEDTVLTVVCFGSFQPCPDPPDSVTVTFVVDMSNEEVSANGVHIAGSMQGWDPAASEMTDADGDGKYEIEFQLATGTSVAYKFVNGNAWGSEETVPDDCVTDGNRTLDVPNFDRPYEVCYGSCEECPAPAVYADVVLTVVDEGNGFEDVEFKGEFSAWDLVQAYDDGTNGDETADDGVWTAVIEDVLGPETYEWGAIENDGSEWGIWLLDIIGLPNQEFTVGEDGTVSGSTSMTIPDQGSLITKTVVFSVDMTEWLDEDGATGMPVFSVARGDTMQVRGGFNGWNCDDPTDCVLTRTPGTNIFSLAVAVEGYIENENEYKFYIQHSMESVSVLEEDNGEMYGDMGWEDSPQFGGGNRVFVLGEDDGTGLLELPLAGYYDLPAGAVVRRPPGDGSDQPAVFRCAMERAAVPRMDCAARYRAGGNLRPPRLRCAVGLRGGEALEPEMAKLGLEQMVDLSKRRLASRRRKHVEVRAHDERGRDPAAPLRQGRRHRRDGVRVDRVQPEPKVRERLGSLLYGHEVVQVEHDDEDAEPRHEQVLNRLKDALAAVVPHAEYDAIAVAFREKIQLSFRFGFVGLFSDARDPRFL